MWLDVDMMSYRTVFVWALRMRVSLSMPKRCLSRAFRRRDGAGGICGLTKDVLGSDVSFAVRGRLGGYLLPVRLLGRGLDCDGTGDH